MLSSTMSIITLGIVICGMVYRFTSAIAENRSVGKMIWYAVELFSFVLFFRQFFI